MWTRLLHGEKTICIFQIKSQRRIIDVTEQATSFLKFETSNYILPAVKIDCEVPEVDAAVGSSVSVNSECNAHKAPKEILPDSCRSSGMVSNSANAIVSDIKNVASVSDSSDDDTATASVTKDEDEKMNTEETAEASALSLLDSENALDDILFDALKGIDGFYGTSSLSV